LDSKDSRTLGEERGNAFIGFLKKGREEIAVGAGNSREDSGTSEETVMGSQAREGVPILSAL
jgi:hypothetical protein